MAGRDHAGGASATIIVPPSGAFGPHHHRSPKDGIGIGSRLNDIFEITQFIAQGGMGAVYQGANVSSGERVAIKVLLPSLTHDQRSWDMFKREANMLVRLSHPSIVQYRVLAIDQNFGVPYIVTEFIDGIPLTELLVGAPPPLPEVLAFLRRLAEGLSVAHSFGAIHRDLSPDNVLLPGGRSYQAKIIDFGIAKDLNASSGTVVGNGFAGKLGYCAPEQLGDYNGDIGPWTDVYSLGLLIYSFAVGKPIEMGATLSQAVDRRRCGVDITSLQPELQELVRGMLQPDPKDRLRSMTEVLAALSVAEADLSARQLGKKEIVASVIGDAARSPIPRAQADATPEATSQRRSPMLIGAGVIAVLALGGVGAMTLLKGGPTHHALRAAPQAPTGINLPQQMAALKVALLSADCSLLQIESVTEARNGPLVTLSGAAGRPEQVAALLSRGANSPYALARNLNFSDVTTVPVALCPVLDALRPGSSGLMEDAGVVTSPQREYALSSQPGGTLEAKAIAAVDLSKLGNDPVFFRVGADTPTVAVAVDAPGAGGAAPGVARLTISADKAGSYGIVAVGDSSTPVHTAGATLSLGDLAKLARAPGVRLGAAWFSVIASSTPSAGTAADPLASPANPAAPAKVKRVRSRASDTVAPGGAATKTDHLSGLY